MKTIIGACLGIALFASQAAAQFWDGNKIKEFLDADERLEAGRGQKGDAFDGARGIGYIVGVADTLQGFGHCLPDGTKVGQLIGIVGKYVRENPEHWNQPASTLIAAALKPAFPCPDSKEEK